MLCNTVQVKALHCTINDKMNNKKLIILLIPQQLSQICFAFFIMLCLKWPLLVKIQLAKIHLALKLKLCGS